MTPLKGYEQRFGETLLCEVYGSSIYSIALALNTQKPRASVADNLGIAWPEPNRSTVSDNGKYRLLGLQSDQCFALIASDTPHTRLPELDEGAYVTDQSDSWASMRLSGPMSRAALERICPIDLHPSVFPVNQVTRTSMEHLAVIILCESDDRYLMLSPTSSSESFLHAIVMSLQNVHE